MVTPLIQRIIKFALSAFWLAAALSPGAELVAAPALKARFTGEWTATEKYAKGDAATRNGSLYQALKNLPRGVQPESTPTAWRLIVTGYRGAGTGGNDCGNPGPGANLVGCAFDATVNPNPLKDLNLSGANLTKVFVTGDLGNIDLTGARLVHASFGEVAQGNNFKPVMLGPKAIFAFADLTALATTGNAALQAESVDFTRANLSDASLQNAKLQGANFTGANLENVSFGGADLSGAVLTNLKLKGVQLYGANLQGAYLDGVDFSQVESNGLDLVDFSRASLSGANFQKLYFGSVNLTGAYLGFADFSGVIVSGTVTVGNDPTTGDTNFEHATCPDGTNVDMTLVTTCVGHGF